MASSPHTLELIIQAVDKASPVFTAVAGALGSVVVGALADAARASEDTEAAIRGLSVAVENAGGAWSQDGAAIEAAIGRYRNLSGVADSQLRPALSNLISETGSVDEGMMRMQTALDLAAGAHISLEQASRLVGKVSDENINVFARMGLSLNDVVTKGMSPAQKEAAVLAAVSSRYAGAAEAAKKPTDDWTNALSDLQENVGGMLGPLRGLVALAPGISTTFTAISAGVTAVLPALAALDLALGPILIAIGAIAAAGLIGYEGASVLTGQGLTNPFGGAPSTAADLGEPGGVANAGAPLYDNYGNQYGAVPGYADGTNYVPSTGLYTLHKGEAVIPADQNRGGSGGVTVNVNGGNFYGMADFENEIAKAVRNVKERGGFRGVI